MGPNKNSSLSTMRKYHFEITLFQKVDPTLLKYVSKTKYITIKLTVGLDFCPSFRVDVHSSHCARGGNATPLGLGVAPF